MKKEDRDWTLSFLYPEDTSEKNKKKKLKRIFCIIEKAYGYYFMKKIYSNSNIYNIDYEDFSNISNYLHENKDLYKDDDIYNIYKQIDKDYPKIKKGIFVSNDTHANILLNILIRNKKDIPDEYEIIGFDNSPISTEAIIPITTVGQDVTKIANESIKLMLRQINLKKRGQLLKTQHITIDTNLFIRETTS